MSESREYSGWSVGRVGVIGAGAMGTSLAAIIGRRVPTVMVCRNPKRASEIFEHGARTSGAVEAIARPILVSSVEDLERVGGVSVVFVATKTTAIPAVARALKPVLRSASDRQQGVFVVSYQNGIDPGRQLMELLEWPQVLRMVLNFGATLRAGSASVEVTLNQPPHAIGAIDPAFAPVCEAIAKTLSAGGLETQVESDIEPRVWTKAIINAAMNPVAALTDSSVGEVLDSPGRAIVARLIDEGLRVARAEGIDLGPNIASRMWAVLDKARPHTPSMVGDIRGGRPSEVGQLNRQIIQHGRRTGVSVPSHEVIAALIDSFDWRVFRRQRLVAGACP